MFDRATTCLTILVALASSTGARAQEESATPAGVVELARDDLRSAAPGVDAKKMMALAADEGVRLCTGCPPRRVGHALLQATYINIFYELANLARGQVTAHITPKTWWANMEQGWVWDLDDFLVNQIGHPYQGNNYFNAGRANGLSYWESAGVTAFGSGTWEYFGETNHASLNDLVNTTLGGIALGEMLHRTAWLVRKPTETGRGRLMSEIAATVIDPITGVNRFISGDSSRVSEKPADMVPSKMSGVGAAGVLWRGSSTSVFESAGDPFVEMNLLYGDPTTGRSRMPYDAFVVMFRFGGGGTFSEAKVRGRLLGQPLGDAGRFQFNVSQAYDFSKNTAYQYGAQSFNANFAYSRPLGKNMSIWASGWGGLTALGAVDSIPLTGKPPEEEDGGGDAGQGVSEGPRYYDYGPGGNFGGHAILSHSGRAVVVFLYEGHHLYTLDGVRANHMLQQLRLDLLAPLRGSLGIGTSAEYFDRRTYFHDAPAVQKFHYPQVRVFLTWRIS
ncbi:MAG: DUF3943 domain-containing protein [Vicinamibacterales bacterium]|nr:DUF3943 domain-containing protein [Vicinamibacterales bacterium]